ncbi:M23 family metallopeptidase [candidate division KSB1 bacterium]|nr:M23 family metallopeptidase [candidate division KSB1 bacterium]
MADSDSRKFWIYAYLLVLLAVIICNQEPTAEVPEEVNNEWLLPLDTGNRRMWSSIVFESDAHFKALRPTWRYRGVRLHTGLDLQNGGQNGTLGGPGENVFAIAAGVVIKISGSLPNKRIVIEHKLPDGRTVWSSYLHIAEPQVREGEQVTSQTVIARRLNFAELRRYGRAYNHLHFEIFKKLPVPRNNHYTWMSQFCYNSGQVDKYFYDPVTFLKERWAEQAGGE